MIDPRTNCVHFCDIEPEQCRLAKESEWCRPGNVNSAESILGSKLVSLCSVELFCINTGVELVPAQGFLGCAASHWVDVHLMYGKHCREGIENIA